VAAVVPATDATADSTQTTPIRIQNPVAKHPPTSDNAKLEEEEPPLSEMFRMAPSRGLLGTNVHVAPFLSVFFGVSLSSIPSISMFCINATQLGFHM